MMDDLHNKIIYALNKTGITATHSDANLKVDVCIDGIDIVLNCDFGETFPYTFPKIYLTAESRAKLDAMPHINTDNSICVFDEGIATPNFNEPVQLAVDTVIKAVDVITKGIRKENHSDFLEEFNAYWNAKAVLKANSFVSDLSTSRIIHFCFQEEENAPLLIGESAENLQQIYKSIHCKDIPLSEIKRGLLIPVDRGLESNIPKTDQDIIHLIQKHSSFSKDYNKFMQSHINEAVLLLFTQITDHGIILSGWVHMGPGIPNGFRQGHMNLAVAFYLSKKKGFALSVEDCSQTRLLNRGGDGKDAKWNNVAIIGCGSLGSLLADMLLLSGTSSYVLNDNEILRFENIARHSRGYWYEGCYKVNAIKFGLEKHNPNIKCQCYTDDAHIFLDQKADILNSCDVIFVAVASFPVEHHICKLVNKGTITKPVVILWVEPYSLGGHALIIKKSQDLFEELFEQSTFDFRYSLVSNSSSLLKREAGCQSTYMPYSGFNLQMFITNIIERVMTETLCKKGNYILTWCGRLSTSADYGIQLTPDAMHASDFTIIERRID